MRSIKYNLFTELEKKHIFSEEEIALIHRILGNINMHIDPTNKTNTFLIRGSKSDPTLSFTKYGTDINGLENGRISITTSPKTITITLGGWVNHLHEEMIYTYSKDPVGLLGNRHYERISYEFETRDGVYSLTAMPIKKSRNVTVFADFYSASKARYLRDRKSSTFEREGILPDYTLEVNSKDGITGLAIGAVSGHLRKFLIRSIETPEEKQSIRPYQKRF